MMMQPDVLKALRKELGWSQQQLADGLGMSRKSIVEMEGGKTPIEQRTALALEALISCYVPIYNERAATSHVGDVPLEDALIIWEAGVEPPVKVLRLGVDDRRYSNSQGSCTSPWQLMNTPWRITRLLALFHEIAVADKIDPSAIHAAFLSIPEYRQTVCPDTVPARYRADDR